MAFTTQTRKLYGGEVTLHFNPNTRNRYQLADGSAPVGVTTVLSKVLAKEALMLWPMNMATGWLRDNCLDKVLTEAHIDEARKAYVKKSDKGKDVGTEVHEAIEQFLISKAENREDWSAPAISPEGTKALWSFLAWFEKVQPKVLATEQIVYSRSGNYAGTFDALLEIDGKVVLCDVKTTNASQSAPIGVYPEYFIQLGAYSMAHTEELPQRFKSELTKGIAEAELTTIRQISDLMVINASKTGKLTTLRASELGLSVQDCEAAWSHVLATYRFMEPLKKLIGERS